MYNVSLGPSKIVSKTRRVMNQNVDRLENNREQGGRKLPHGKENSNSNPRPVFHNLHRKSGSHRQQVAVTAEYEGIVRFVSDNWNEVRKEYQTQLENKSTGSNSTVYYEEEGLSKNLEDFKPFDLEAWWGRKLFNNLTKSCPEARSG